MYFTSLRHLVANVNFFLVSATAAVAVVARAVVFLYETNPGSDGQRNTFGSCLAVVWQLVDWTISLRSFPRRLAVVG